jgi:hypothetical protein
VGTSVYGFVYGRLHEKNAPFTIVRHRVTWLRNTVVFSRIVYGAIRLNKELVNAAVTSVYGAFTSVNGLITPGNARKCLISYHIRSVSILYFH